MSSRQKMGREKKKWSETMLSQVICEEMASDGFSKAEVGKRHLRTGLLDIYPTVTPPALFSNLQ